MKTLNINEDTIETFRKMPIKRLDQYDKIIISGINSDFKKHPTRVKNNTLLKISLKLEKCKNKSGRKIWYQNCNIIGVSKDVFLHNSTFKNCLIEWVFIPNRNRYTVPYKLTFKNCTIRHAYVERQRIKIIKCTLVDTNICNRIPEGDLIVYKGLRNNCIAKLKIPADAKRTTSFYNKCRADKAQVLEIYKYDKNNNKINIKKAYSLYDFQFIYKVGKTIHSDKFDNNRFNECSNGIHFFFKEKDAIEWMIDSACFLSDDLDATETFEIDPYRADF